MTYGFMTYDSSETQLNTPELVCSHCLLSQVGTVLRPTAVLPRLERILRAVFFLLCEVQISVSLLCLDFFPVKQATSMSYAPFRDTLFKKQAPF